MLHRVNFITFWGLISAGLGGKGADFFFCDYMTIFFEFLKILAGLTVLKLKPGLIRHVIRPLKFSDKNIIIESRQDTVYDGQRDPYGWS